MVHSPPFSFNYTLPASTDVLEAHHLLEQVCCISLPSSTFDDSAVFSGASHQAFTCGESSEEAPAAEGCSGSGTGSGSASPSEEAQPSQHGETQQRQQSSGSRGRGGRSSESKHPLYKGIRKRQGGRWVSEIREPGKKSRIWLGTFPTPEMAARAYDVAAFTLKKPYAYVNFPEAVSSLPIPQSLSPKHIQEAASAAATAFQPAASSSHAGKTGGVVPTLQVGESSSLSPTSSPVAGQQQPPSTSSPMPEQQQPQSSTSFTVPEPEEQELHPQSATPQTTAPSFVDEDMIFNMPNVLADMAEGLMMTPPLLHHGAVGDNNNGNNDGAELSLWDL